MQCICAVSEHCNIFSAIEKRIADRAVADAFSLEFFDAGDIYTFSRRAGRDYNGGADKVILRARYGVIAVPTERKNLFSEYIRPQLFCLLDAAFYKLCTGNCSRAEIILYLFRFFQRSAVLADNGAGEPGALYIERRRQSCGTAADNSYIVVPVHMCLRLK